MPASYPASVLSKTAFIIRTDTQIRPSEYAVLSPSWNGTEIEWQELPYTLRPKSIRRAKKLAKQHGFESTAVVNTPQTIE